MYNSLLPLVGSLYHTKPNIALTKTAPPITAPTIPPIGTDEAGEGEDDTVTVSETMETSVEVNN